MASSTGVEGESVKGFWVIKSDTILMFCLAGVEMKTRLSAEKEEVGVGEWRARMVVRSRDLTDMLSLC